MKKFLSILLLIFINVLGFSQLRPIAKKINDLQSKKELFVNVKPFLVDDTSNKQAKYLVAATDAKVLKLQPNELSKIVTARPNAIEMSLPYNGGEIAIQLVQNDIFGGKNLIVNTDKGLYKGYKPGVYYQGIIKGDNKSVVAVSFFEDDVVGVVSLAGGNNIIVGKATSSEDFVIYTDSKLTGANPFICKTDEMLQTEKEKITFNPKTSKAPTQTQNVVRVYYEICYNPFVQNNSNVTTTTNWLTAIHNNIATLYTNDGVRTALHELFIWTSKDPYNAAAGNHSQNLVAFRSNRAIFNGDLAHLVNYPSTTSVAYVNSLCGSNRYAYSGIDKSYQNIPTYSWTIMAMTHEMGHALGSPHTHACAWNGDGTPIDGCAPTYSSSLSEGDCDTGPIPSKGTIMSYCHLLPSVGIDFTLGFGPQPGALIRETVDSKACLNTDGQTSCPVTVTGLAISNVNKNGATATITDNVSTDWRYEVVKLDGTVVKSGVTNTKVINFTDLQPKTYYEVRIGGNCGSTKAYQQKQLILTDTNWCGEVFVSPAGADGNYGNSQYLVKTFYPDQPNQKLKLSFTMFDLESGFDFLTVRNGPTASSPIFSGASNMSGTAIRGPFESTHDTGAITVVFRSDAAVTGKGWTANFDCKVLSTNEVLSKEMNISPNPTKGPVDIRANANIDEITILDASGKVINVIRSLKVNEQSIDLSSYPAGTYVVMIKSGNDTVTKKVIKK